MMRRQVYEWRAVVPSDSYSDAFVLNQEPVLTQTPAIPAWRGNAAQGLDVFVGGLGTNLDIPGFVKATQFFVIDELSVWPPLATANIWVETSRYFQRPDRAVAAGVSGNAAPFGPSGGTRYDAQSLSNSFHMSDTPMYVLPGQTWGVYYAINQLQQSQVAYDNATGGAAIRNWDYSLTTAIDPEDGDIWIPRCYLEYVLFDGADALIASFLMKQDIPVTVETVQAHKRMLIRHKLMADISERNELEAALDGVPRRLS